MAFYEVIRQAVKLVQHQGKLTYRTLKRQFDLDDDALEDLKGELLFSYPVADEEGQGLIWTGERAERLPDTNHETEGKTRFHAALSAIIIFLQHEERATYRELQHAFGLDDELLDDIKKVLQFKRLAIDEEEKGLVWAGKAQSNRLPAPSETIQQVTSPVHSSLSTLIPETETQDNRLTAVPEQSHRSPAAENRQLTVVFCDLAESTRLSQQLDPEDLREVVRAYQETAAEVVKGYEGHIAQYLGDGLLIYFGWPQAHENDAERAVYTGLEIPQAIDTLNHHLQTDHGVQLAVRIGIHTGPVVVGEMGSGDRYENLALGETPNIAARLEGLAQPNTMVISLATAQLIQRSFILEELGQHELKGVADPMQLYMVVGTRETEYDDHEEILAGGFDTLVGRDEEIGLLLRRWEQSKESQGQVVLMSGEAGLGKSSLVEGLCAHVHQEGYTRIAFRCSPYTTNSAMHPVIEHVKRVLGWKRDDTVETRLDKLEQAIQQSSLPMEETVPLLASLLSLPMPEDQYPALTLSPQRQRQLTQDALVAWILEEAEHQPVLAVWEDIHWADPSTLELLALFIEQTPTVSILNVLAFRPEFTPSWPAQSHITPITLNRLERHHIESLVRRLAGDKTLPTELVDHVVGKTDGVPLYIEELTKMLLKSDLLKEDVEAYVLTGPLSSASIPATLQDSLMARLDSLPDVKEVAQLGSVLGREFDYDMLQAMNVIDGPTLQSGLSQLVGHELLYQRGRIPRATFIFRHVLIRDAAYHSLLRRTRQQYHKRVAQLLETRFSETIEMQPERVAHHYTEAGRNEPAVSYWHRAGQKAIERSANWEAVCHLTKGLELINMIPDTPERHQQELDLQVALGSALLSTQGMSSPEVERTYDRARVLCEQMEDTSQLFPILRGLILHYQSKGQLQAAIELGEQLLRLAQSQSNAALLLVAHSMLGMPLFTRGDTALAHTHFTKAVAIYQPQEHQALAYRYGVDLGLASQAYQSRTLWRLGYPDQALQHSQAAVRLAREVSHPYSLANTLLFSAFLYQYRREASKVCEQASAMITLMREQGFAERVPRAMMLHGWALAMQGQGDIGIAEMRQAFDDDQASGSVIQRSTFLGLLAEVYGESGHPDEGLSLLDEAIVVMEATEIRNYGAELYRLKGMLLLRQAAPNTVQAESCFRQSLAIARSQQAKSWELRAATSLARLWQHQGKAVEAREILAPVYEWFTEGFDTADLIDAKSLLDELEGKT